MTPKPFSGGEFAYVKGQDPRQKLVDWMTAKDNPYFARAISNRHLGPLPEARAGRGGR